jgi:N-acetylmuramoyl-L-alanine amidase
MKKLLFLFFFTLLFAKDYYIHIKSFAPLTIKIPSNSVKHFIIKDKNVYKEVFDIKNAITPKFYKKRFGQILLRIAQFNPKVVRIVYSSNKKFDLNYSIQNKILKITLTPKKTTKKTLPTPKKVIVIDPGHGGKDPGGIGYNRIYEKDVVLKVAIKLKKILQNQGYKVYLTRSKDKFIDLKERPHFANIKKADLFISLHCNVAYHHKKNIQGLEVYYLSPADSKRALEIAKQENQESLGNLNFKEQMAILTFLNTDKIMLSKTFAFDVKNSIASEIKKFYSLKRAEVRAAPFYVLTGTQMPAILIEMGYLTNPKEAKKLASKKYQNLIAKGIAKGINKFFSTKTKFQIPSSQSRNYKPRHSQ